VEGHPRYGRAVGTEFAAAEPLNAPTGTLSLGFRLAWGKVHFISVKLIYSMDCAV